MAKGSAKPASDPAPSQPADEASPAPTDKLHVTFTTLAPGEILHRVHLSKYQPDQFNPGVQGDARFSPIQNEQGEPIPTLYGETTRDCALMETVFHDVPHTAGFKSFDAGKLAEQMHSTVRVEQELQLANLASVPLRKLGVTRKQLKSHPAEPCYTPQQLVSVACPSLLIVVTHLLGPARSERLRSEFPRLSPLPPSASFGVGNLPLMT